MAAYKHSAMVRLLVIAAREQSRWLVQLRRAYRAEQHAHRRARLWLEGTRCKDRIKPLMEQARKTRTMLMALPA